MADTFYILDGHAQIYRAFYAPLADLTSPGGEPTRATYVFCQMLLNLIRDRRPDYLAMAMDVSDERVFRCELDSQYKANRDPAPEALHVQADRIVSIVSAMNIPIYRVEGYEADDVMATITHRLSDRDVDVYLVSRDKDLQQLITDRVRLFDPVKNIVVDAEGLLETKGYTPEQAVEIQTLSGDPTDNIPGVHLVGTKTAAKLIRQYGSARSVLDHADDLPPKMARNVKDFAEQMAVTRKLVTLRKDVPLEFDLDACAIGLLDATAPRPIFEELGFSRLHEALDELFGGASPSSLTPGAQPRESRPSRDYHLVDTSAALDEFASMLGEQSVFAFDTETTGLNAVRADLVGLSFSWSSGQAYYIPVRAAMGRVLSCDEVVAKLKPVFENASIAKVGHNIKYDLLVLRQVGIKPAGVAFDTMIASFLIDPLRSSHSLDGLARTLLGHEMIPITDLIGKGRNQITIDQVDSARVCEYAAEDADFTWRLYENLSPRMVGSHAENLFRETELPLLEVLVEMEHSGIALNDALLADLGGAMAQRMTELTREVHQAAGREFNIDSTKQLATVLFDEQGLPVIRKTKTGRSTDADTLQALAAKSRSAIPKLVLEYRELAKLRGTYVETLPKMVYAKTGRIHASFNPIGAITGRLSSSDPNLQNIPVRTEMGRLIRGAFVAGNADSVLLIADYSQIELRLLAHFCGDDALLEAFNTGQDIHKSVAAQVNGVELSDVTPAQRSAAKAVNFGIIYGQSAFGLARSLGIPVGEASAFIDTYFLRYPGIRLFIDKCVEETKRSGYAETILGRRRPIGELRSRNRTQQALGQRLAVNTVVQGSAADLIKRAMIDIHCELQDRDYSARMLIQVHDELVFEVAEKDVQREAEMIRRKMEGAIALDVPIVVDVAWGKTWAQAKA